MSDKTIWVLADDRAGNNSQSLGVAEALGFETEIKQIRYTKWVKLPNCLRGASTIGIDKSSVERLKPPFPDFAIAAGRRAAPVLRWLKKQSGGKTKIIQIMFAGNFGLKDFDLVVLPEHDGCKLVRPNILRVVGAPHRITSERLKNEREKWADAFKDLPAPRIALIVGGATKDKPFTPAMAQDLADKAVSFSKTVNGGSFLVTTSRRTGAEQEKILRDTLPDPKYFYGWGDTQAENPYFGFLACADYILVTGDSVSMCSEACAAKAPVFIYAPQGSVGKKHALLHQQLYDGGYARPLDGKTSAAEHNALNAAQVVADAIKRMF